jgi:hypothetical protein
LSDDSNDLLISQYEQCWSDIRDHRTRYWQIPLATGAVDLAVLAIIFQFADKITLVEKALLSILVLYFSATLIHQLLKERFFENVRTRELEVIQSMIELPSYHMHFRSDDALKAGFKDVQKGWIYEQSAFDSLKNALFLITAIVIVTIFVA